MDENLNCEHCQRYSTCWGGPPPALPWRALAKIQDLPWDSGFWTRTTPATIWQCTACGRFWSLQHDPYHGGYIEAWCMPETALAILRADATPQAVLQQLSHPALHGLIAGYFQLANLDLPAASAALLRAMRGGHEARTDALLLRCLHHLLQQAQSRGATFALPQARDLRALLQRHDLSEAAAQASSLAGALRAEAQAIARLLLRADPALVSVDAATRLTLSEATGIQPLPWRRKKAPPSPALDAAEQARYAAALAAMAEPAATDAPGAGSSAPATTATQAPAHADEDRPITASISPAQRAPEGAAAPSPQPASTAPKPARASTPSASAPAITQHTTPAALARTYLVLIFGSAALCLPAAFLLGELLIPAGAFLFSVLLAVALMVLYLMLAFRCQVCRRAVLRACAVAVLIGSWGLGHYYAYAVDAQDWAARYFAQGGEQGQHDALWRQKPREQLLQDMLRIRLQEADAGGPIDALRLRAQLGSNVLVSQRYQALPDRGVRDTWQMWAAWWLQLLLAVGGSIAIYRLLPADEA